MNRFIIGAIVASSMLVTSIASADNRSRIGGEQSLGTGRAIYYHTVIEVPTFPPIDGQNDSLWIGLLIEAPAGSNGLHAYNLLQPILNFGADDTATGRGNYWSITPELNSGQIDSQGNVSSNSSTFGLTYVVNPGEHIDESVEYQYTNGNRTQRWRVQLDDLDTGVITYRDYDIVVADNANMWLEVEQEFVGAVSCADTPTAYFRQMAAFDSSRAPIGLTFPRQYTSQLPALSCSPQYGPLFEPYPGDVTFVVQE